MQVPHLQASLCISRAKLANNILRDDVEEPSTYILEDPFRRQTNITCISCAAAT
jgi:hypothetical protein